MYRHLSGAETKILQRKKTSFTERAVLYGYYAVKTALRADLLAKSAALSYTAVFSLVPLVATLLAFLTAFPGLENERERFMGMLSGYLLPGAVQGVQGKLAQFSDRAAAAGSLSSLVFFALVLLLFQSMEIAMNSIWDADRARRWTERLRALAFFLILAGLGTTLFVVIRDQAGSFTQGRYGWAQAGAFSPLVADTVNMLVAWGLFAAANLILPNVKVKIPAALIGGVFAGTLWHFLKGGFTWYVENMASYENIYGALGAVPVFFLWVYLSFVLLLAGASLACAVQNLEDSVFQRQSAGSEYPRGYFSVAVGSEIARAFHAREAPLSQEELASRLDIPHFCIRDSLRALGTCGLILEIPAEEGPAYVLAEPAEAIDLWRIVEGVSGGALKVPDRLPEGSLPARLSAIFGEAAMASRKILERTTLRDLQEGKTFAGIMEPKGA